MRSDEGRVESELCCHAGDDKLGLLEQLSMLLRVTVAQAQQQVHQELAGLH